MRFRITLLLFLCWFSVAASELKFAWLTDIHVVEGNANSGQLAKAVAEINAGDSEFVILSGDLTNTGDNQLVFAARLLSELKKPLYAIPGNHETNWSRDPGLEEFSRLFGGRTFVFRAGNILFAGFPSGPWGHMGDGYVEPADLASVGAKLDAGLKPGDRVVFVCHYPLTSDVGNVREVILFMKKYPVAAVLSGHTHQLALLNADGISNAVGRALSLRHSDETDAGYNLVTMGDDGRITIYNKTIGRDPVKAYSFIPGDGAGEKIEYVPFAESSVPELKNLGRVKYFPVVPEYAPPGGGARIGFRLTPDCLEAFDAQSGKRLWTFSPEGRFQAPPAVRDGLVAVGMWGQPRLFVLDAVSGKMKWSWNDGSSEVLFSPGNVTPVIGERNIAIVAPDRYLTIFDRETGEVKLRSNEYKFRESLGPGSDGRIANAKTMDGKLVVIDVDAAHIVNAFDAGLGFEHTPVPPLELNGDVIMAGHRGDLVRISPASGGIKWHCRPSECGYTFVGQVALPGVGSRLAAVADDGNVFVFDAN
ncbi:MAG: metallophosphoesterase [Victivallaceae bacterium]|nr:metallophosphoesterase [Victivallaceae bacterium]